jgi:hypothetical protein
MGLDTCLLRKLHVVNTELTKNFTVLLSFNMCSVQSDWPMPKVEDATTPLATTISLTTENKLFKVVHWLLKQS